MAGRTILTFSGYDADAREIFQIPEIRAYTAQLDQRLPELPALLAYLSELGFNGPGLYLMLLGEIAQMVHRPERAGFDVEVRGGERIIAQAISRIRQAATRYQLPHNAQVKLEQDFHAGVTFRLR